jgi:hypothetical protein
VTRPFEKWPTLWEFFMVLHEDWRNDHPDEDSAMNADLLSWSTDVLTEALREWHEAFDGASDEQVSAIVGDFNPSYDPAEKFSGDRGWAEWVREHLERELASRKA